MRASTVVAIFSLIAWVAFSVALPPPPIKFERAGERPPRLPSAQVQRSVRPGWYPPLPAHSLPQTPPPRLALSPAPAPILAPAPATYISSDHPRLRHPPAPASDLPPLPHSPPGPTRTRPPLAPDPASVLAPAPAYFPPGRTRVQPMK